MFIFFTINVKKIFIFLFFLTLLLGCLCTFPKITKATTFYVSSSGNDLNDGLTAATPWNSITKINVQTFLPGDNILFKKGDSWLNSTFIIPSAGTEGKNITLGAYGEGNKPIISAAVNNAAITVTAANRGYWTIDGLDLRATGNPGGIDNSVAIYFNYWPSEMGPVPGWIIQNNNFNAAVFVCGPDLTIRNNIFNGAGNALNIHGGIIIRGPNADNTLISGNTISNYSGRGIWMYNKVENSEVINNTIHDIPVYHDVINGWYESMGINDDGYGTPSLNNKIHGNTIYNAEVGIALENSFDSEIYNNNISGSERGISIINYDEHRNQPNNSSVHNNLIVNSNQAGIILWFASYWNFYNNTIHNGVGSDSRGFNIWDVSPYVSHLNFENNIVSGTWIYPIYVPDATLIWTKFDYNNIIPVFGNIMWQGGTGKTLTNLRTAGMMTHGITSDPLFISPTDFHLQSTSPAVNAGTNVVLTEGYDENPIVGLPDIGAFESNYIIDTTKPTITSFTIPSASNSLTVPITTFTVADNIDVMGYLLTETSTTPFTTNTNWVSSIPVSYTFSTSGATSLYAWAKDASENISASVNRTVEIILPSNGGSSSGGGGGGSVTVPIPTSITIRESEKIASYADSKLAESSRISEQKNNINSNLDNLSLDIKESISPEIEKFLQEEKKLTSVGGNYLAGALSGRLLLQVENHGEAWYVNPINKLKYYLGTPKMTYSIMKKLGLGISNKNLEKIKIANFNLDNGLDTDKDGLSDAVEDSIGSDKNKKDSDSDGYDDEEEMINGYNTNGKNKLLIDNILSNKLKGRIVIQVEGHGEAWYIYPVTNTRYYLGKPSDAYSILRSLSLGISNQNLRKIRFGETQ